MTHKPPSSASPTPATPAQRVGAGSRGPSAGALLQLIREGRASTRADLVELTGLARSTVAQRIDELVRFGLVTVDGASASTGGRPPTSFSFNAGAGVVLGADLGVTHSHLAISDYSGTVLAHHRETLDIGLGPDAFVAWLTTCFDELLTRCGRDRSALGGIGAGLPGPVEFMSGRPIKPPIMPGWDNFPFAERLSEEFGCPVFVDNDVNMMTLGEHRTRWRDTDELLYVKVGSGIGCGFVGSGQVHRGNEGAAGDIGHIRVSGHSDVLCHCGNTACLEAVAGGRALVAELRRLGFSVERSADVVALANTGEAAAVQLIRRSGRLLGEVLAAAVNLINPGLIVIGGDLAKADHHLLAGVREGVYQRSTPLATQNLRITRSTLDDDAGIAGATVLVLEHILAPDAIDSALTPA